MNISVKRLKSADRPVYRDFIRNCDKALVFHTSEYLDVLSEILPNSELSIFAAYNDLKIVGTLAAFVCRNDYGVVLNSLPYFGSHGDILLANELSDSKAVITALTSNLIGFCKKHSIEALNIVSHPLAPCIETSIDDLGLVPWDSRIGQISHLPKSSNYEEALGGVLANCRQKTRNLVRKGIRQDFDIFVSTEDEDWARMISHHQLGMKKIGGKAKSAHEFSVIRDVLEAEGLCRLYVAKFEGEFAGALLNLYHRDWVEYFTPVAVETFRNKQVLSALIAKAMCDASVEGRKFWNWGGTWSSQAGVHHFKQGWGAIDHNYNYFGAVWNSRLSEAKPQELLEQFPFFYVRPFVK